MMDYKLERKFYNYTLLTLFVLPVPIIIYLDSNEMIMDWLNEHFIVSIIFILFFINVINLIMRKWDWKIFNKQLIDNNEEKFLAYLESSKDRRPLKEKILTNRTIKTSFDLLLTLLWFVIYWSVAISLTMVLPYFLIVENGLSMYMFFPGWIIFSLIFAFPLIKVDKYIQLKLKKLS